MITDFDKVIPVLLMKYMPVGVLGLGLTALMASFMSGMAGNVSAFNTVFTYDIYQSYIKPNQARQSLPEGGTMDHGGRGAGEYHDCLCGQVL